MSRSASNFTSTVLSGRSETLLTVPTRMPATRTESPALSRDTSANTAEYPFVDPVRYWPKMTNRKTVNTAITTTKAPNLMTVRRAPVIRVARSVRCCAVARR